MVVKSQDLLVARFDPVRVHLARARHDKLTMTLPSLDPRSGCDHRIGPVAHHAFMDGESREAAAGHLHVQIAVRDNAHWCDAVCRAHGLPCEFAADAWTSARRTPRYYPDAVSLSATASAEHVLDRIDMASPGCSVKDSFACLDLTGAAFRVLLEAEWIHRSPPGPTPDGRQDIRWVPISNAAELVTWEAAWGAGQEEPGLFPPTLLANDSVTFLGGWLAGRLVAGCVATSSQTAVGISNLFIRDDDLDAAWTGALEAVSHHFPGRPVVGYESGDALAAAVRHEFTPVGPLRIWLRDT
jgi:hypothetical protein